MQYFDGFALSLPTHPGPPQLRRDKNDAGVGWGDGRNPSI